MKTLRQKQKEEALKRMSILKIMKEVREDFEKNDRVYYSERQSAIFNATLYWLDNNADYVQIVKDFEKKHNALVYHCQLTHLTYGDNLSILYVSKHENEWEKDKELLRSGETFAYVKNLEDDFCSDMGYIGIKPSMGGVLRTA